MSALIHTADMLGSPVRFFRSPLPGEDFPWHAVNDLHVAMRLPKVVRNDLQGRMRRDWSHDVRTITVDGKALVIAPHAMAQGVTGAMDQVAGHPEDGPLYVAYCKAILEASRKQALFDGLTPVEELSRTLRVAARGGAGHVH